MTRIKTHCWERGTAGAIGAAAVELKESTRFTDPLTLAELEPHHCRWPVSAEGERETLFCAAPASFSSSYCEHHADKAVSDKPRLNTKRYARALALYR